MINYDDESFHRVIICNRLKVRKLGKYVCNMITE